MTATITNVTFFFAIDDGNGNPFRQTQTWAEVEQNIGFSLPTGEAMFTELDPNNPMRITVVNGFSFSEERYGSLLGIKYEFSDGTAGYISDIIQRSGNSRNLDMIRGRWFENLSLSQIKTHERWTGQPQIGFANDFVVVEILKDELPPPEPELESIQIVNEMFNPIDMITMNVGEVITLYAMGTFRRTDTGAISTKLITEQVTWNHPQTHTSFQGIMDLGMMTYTLRGEVGGDEQFLTCEMNGITSQDVTLRVIAPEPEFKCNNVHFRAIPFTINLSDVILELEEVITFEFKNENTQGIITKIYWDNDDFDEVGSWDVSDGGKTVKFNIKSSTPMNQVEVNFTVIFDNGEICRNSAIITVNKKVEPNPELKARIQPSYSVIHRDDIIEFNVINTGSMEIDEYIWSNQPSAGSVLINQNNNKASYRFTSYGEHSIQCTVKNYHFNQEIILTARVIVEIPEMIEVKPHSVKYSYPNIMKRNARYRGQRESEKFLHDHQEQIYDIRQLYLEIKNLKELKDISIYKWFHGEEIASILTINKTKEIKTNEEQEVSGEVVANESSALQNNMIQLSEGSPSTSTTGLFELKRRMELLDERIAEAERRYREYENAYK